MAFELEPRSALAGGLVSLLVNALFVYFAGRIVLDRGALFASIFTALVGSFLAALVFGAVGGTPGLILAGAVWALVAAFFFRTEWLKGAVVGLVAGVLWILVSLVIDWLSP